MRLELTTFCLEGRNSSQLSYIRRYDILLKRRYVGAPTLIRLCTLAIDFSSLHKFCRWPPTYSARRESST